MRYNTKLFINTKKSSFKTINVDMSDKVWIPLRYKVDGTKYNAPTKLLIEKSDIEKYSHRV